MTATLTRVGSDTPIAIEGCQVAGPSGLDTTRLASFFVERGAVARGQRFELRVRGQRFALLALEARACKRGLEQVIALVVGPKGWVG